MEGAGPAGVADWRAATAVGVAGIGGASGTVGGGAALAPGLDVVSDVVSGLDAVWDAVGGRAVSGGRKASACNAPGGGWEVLVDGLSLGMFDSANGNSMPAPDHTSDWLDRTVSFVATAEEMELKFLAFKNPQIMVQDPTFQFLDNVSVSPVPEPSTTLLLAFGMLGLATCLRRR